MNFIVQLVRRVMFPLGIVLAIIMGVIAAFLSAVIEFDVVRNCFSASFGNNFFFFPLLVVFSFEAMKLALHFCESAFFKSGYEINDKKMVTFFNIVKWSLVCFSVLCSFVFTAHSLYESVPERREEYVMTKIQTIKEEYKDEYIQYETSLEKNYDLAIHVVKEKADAAEKNLKKILDAQAHHVKQSENLIAAQKQFDEAFKEYKEVSSVETEKKNTRLYEKKEELRKNYEVEVEKIIEDAQFTSEFDNQYIRTFILSLSNTFGVSDYSRTVYMIIICAISISISVILESIISVAFSIMSLPPAMLIKAASIPDKVESIGQNYYEDVLKAIVNILISFAVFSAYAAIIELNFGGKNLFITMMCFVMVTLVFKNLPIKEKRTSKIGHYMYEAQIHIMKGAIGFAGYIVLGLIFGSTIQELTPAAIGITIGSSIGGVVGSGINDVTNL